MSNYLPTEFSYDPDTGSVFRKGKLCSQKGNKEGYLRASFKGKQYYQHQLAFFLVEKRWAKEIDHINGIKSDNRWSNLREVTRSQNNMNKRSLNLTKRPHNWWEVRVVKDKEVSSEKYKCFGQAVKAAKKLKQEVHGEFAL